MLPPAHKTSTPTAASTYNSIRCSQPKKAHPTLFKGVATPQDFFMRACRKNSSQKKILPYYPVLPKAATANPLVRKLYGVATPQCLPVALPHLCPASSWKSRRPLRVRPEPAHESAVQCSTGFWGAGPPPLCSGSSLSSPFILASYMCPSSTSE